MTTFTFTRQFHGFGSPKTTVEFDADQLEDVLENFTNFLRGCGYQFDGHLEIAETMPSEIKTNSTEEKIDLDAFTNNLFNNMNAGPSVVVGGGGIDTITIGGGKPFGINDNYIV